MPGTIKAGPVTSHLLDRPDLIGASSAIGAAVCGALGATAGLVIGLLAYAPTAVFAMLELGVPAVIAGGVLGLLFGVVARALHHG